MHFLEVAIIIIDIKLVGLNEYTHKLHKKNFFYTLFLYKNSR